MAVGRLSGVLWDSLAFAACIIDDSSGDALLSAIITSRNTSQQGGDVLKLDVILDRRKDVAELLSSRDWFYTRD
uniref:Uncharacterized protein n=1 Tax=Parascaris equorum TaxID=6256 RepID=A0A914RI57_PAREQ